MHRLAVLSLLGLLYGGAAQAQVFDSPRALGMGGAVRGDPIHNSAVIYNPAGMSRVYTYSAEAQFYRRGGVDANAAGINVVDSKTQPALAVGVAYGYEFTDSEAPLQREGHNARLAFAHAVVPNQLHLGVGLHYLHLDRDAALGDLKGFTADAGMLLSASGNLHIGIVGQNLVNLHDAEAPVLTGGGIAYTGDPITLDMDVMADLTTADDPAPVIHAGLELLLAQTVPLRAGFERNEATDVTYVSGGLGFVTASEGSAGGQVNVAYRQGLDSSKNFHFGIGLTFFL